MNDTGIVYKSDIEQLLPLVRRCISEQTNDWCKTRWKELGLIFYQWKEEKGSPPEDLNSLLECVARGINPGEELRPYHYAGYGVSNYIDLAFKLWVEEYEPFAGHLKEHGFAPTWAVIVLNNCDTGNAPSIIRATSMLTDLRLNVTEEMIKEMAPDSSVAAKQRQSLSEGRIQGTEVNKARREQNKKNWWQMAVETFMRNPNWDYSRVISHIQEQPAGKRKGSPYAHSTIRDEIGGAKDEALERLSKKQK